MSDKEFEKFTRLVLADESLQEALRDLTDRNEFVARVVDLGAIHGFAFSPQAVEDAMRANRRVWTENEN